MLEHAIYSVASPEGCAAILWGDAGQADEAAARLELHAAKICSDSASSTRSSPSRSAAPPRRRRYVARVLDAIDAALARLARFDRNAATESLSEIPQDRRRVDVKRARLVLRVLTRVSVVVFVCVIVTIVGIQYARVIRRNVALAHSLHDVESDVRSLEAKRAQQQRDIVRLSDPHGVIPEIHEKLHLVSDHEAIIYLKKHDGK